MKIYCYNMSVEKGEKKLYKYLVSKKNKKELKKIYKNNTNLSKDKLIEKIIKDLPSSEVFSGSLFSSLE